MNMLNIKCACIEPCGTLAVTVLVVEVASRRLRYCCSHDKKLALEFNDPHLLRTFLFYVTKCYE